MAEPLGVGIIGCGNISRTYFELARVFSGYEIKACADLRRSAAEVRAAEYGVKAMTVRDLLAADDIDLIINLTVPDAHYMVSREILAHDKHVYSEKPLVLRLEDGLALRELADRKQLLVGCAPDTFLGGAPQTARQAIDTGVIGRVTGGTCHMMSHGMEAWHPNPDFFFKPGGGPVLDMGPYYIAALVNLIGPVRRVASLSSSGMATRVIGSGDRKGEKIDVETPTNVHALLEFANDATFTLSTSWDVWSHRHSPIEIYGTKGTLFLPDPNFFGGDVEFASPSGVTETLKAGDHPFAVPNFNDGYEKRANYRGAGLADMVRVLKTGGQPRCSLDGALHALDVLNSILRSGETGTFVNIAHTASKPEALTPEQAAGLLA
ncbi:Gfo/Idh/MocA family oxidoreductase [Roseibium denhamense]|uniref:Predicted dehydrogenase n=1 Tax=Roseibium denhamense TaxID=76305 RepID=A0ABY1NU26_9HYPH|nr:Gfo/Idh/MocA family oxidoreductase [Roseibium denhamense]MTI05493.1 Gfo/Idh/MocA family oxidoreductase [Roseibium denhamense]SMP18182.1 Predicted dehydrogenase [Roseibium denhamense]